METLCFCHDPFQRGGCGKVGQEMRAFMHVMAEESKPSSGLLPYKTKKQKVLQKGKDKDRSTTPTKEKTRGRESYVSQA